MNALALARPSLPGNVLLPGSYEAAVQALATCSRLDECKDWADKTAALASYATQSRDATLHNHAKRIQTRAIRRCGELLLHFEAKAGKEKAIQPGARLNERRVVAARAVGLTRHQQLQAVRIALVPPDTFEVMVESKRPPTLTKLATFAPRLRAVSPKPTSHRPVLDKSREATQARLEQMTEMAKEGHSSGQIAAAVGTGIASVRRVMKKAGIQIPADRVLSRSHHPKAARILERMVVQAESLTSDAGLIKFRQLKPSDVADWLPRLQTARQALDHFYYSVGKGASLRCLVSHQLAARRCTGGQAGNQSTGPCRFISCGRRRWMSFNAATIRSRPKNMRPTLTSKSSVGPL